VRTTRCGTEIEHGPVLVTGAGGFAGAHIMEGFGLGEGDCAVDVTDGFTAPPGVRKVAWRLPNPAPESLGGFRFVVHLAALSSVESSRFNPKEVYAVNLMGTIELLDFVLARCPEAKVLLVSSSEVYQPSGKPVSEESPLNPGSPYAASKAAMEHAARHYLRQAGLSVVIARSFPHYGPGQSGRFALPSFCRRIIEARRNGDEALRVGNLYPVRDYLHVRDVVRAYALLLSRGEAGEVYNVCSGVGVSMGEMLETLLRVSGTELNVRTDPSLARNDDHSHQVGNPAKLNALGGFVPTVGHEEGLLELYSWWSRRMQ